jgi:hypothetical protein
MDSPLSDERRVGEMVRGALDLDVPEYGTDVRDTLLSEPSTLGSGSATIPAVVQKARVTIGYPTLYW